MTSTVGRMKMWRLFHDIAKHGSASNRILFSCNRCLGTIPASSDACVQKETEEDRRASGKGSFGFVKTSASTIVSKRMNDLIESSHPQEALDYFQTWKDGKASDTLGDFRPNLAVYSAVMSATSRVHRNDAKDIKLQAIKDVFHDMNEAGLRTNVQAYNEALRQCSRLRDDDLARVVFEEMGKADIQPNKMTYLQLISSAVQNRQLSRALDFYEQFQSLPGNMGGGLARFAQRTLQGLLASCVRTQRMEESEAILRDFKELGLQVSPLTLGELILSAAGADLESVTISLMEMLEDYPDRFLDEGTLLHVLQSAARIRSTVLSELGWSSLEQTMHHHGEEFPSLAASHARLACLVRTGRLEEAMDFLFQVEEREPSIALNLKFASSIADYAASGETVADKIYFMLEERLQSGKGVPISAMNAIISACSAMGDLERSFATYEELKGTFNMSPNSATFSALMSGCVTYGKPESAKPLVEEMKSLGIQEDKEIYVLLIDAALLTDGIDHALRVLKEMENAGFVPPLKTMQKLRALSESSSDPSGIEEIKRISESHGLGDRT